MTDDKKHILGTFYLFSFCRLLSSIFCSLTSLVLRPSPLVSPPLLSIVLLLLFSLAAVGCGKEKGKKVEETTGQSFEIVKEYKRGPVTFNLKVDRKELTIADRLRLELEVRVGEEFEVRLPEFGDKLDQFGIVDYRSPTPRLVEQDMTLYRKSYVLEPFLSGEYKIPAMKVIFWKKGEAEEKKHEMESEPLDVSVKSLIPEKVAELTIEEIVPPMDIPAPAVDWLYLIIGVGILSAGGIAGFVLWQRKRGKSVEAVRRAAHEIAYDELEALLAEKLVEQGEPKSFYLRLSNILCHYIEDRFGLRAPERTTEEFLMDLRSTDVLVPSHKELLKKFLQHCDMVKFAEHQPGNEEIQGTFDACKQFIADTEPREEPHKR